VAAVPTAEIVADPVLFGVTVAVALIEPPAMVTDGTTDATPELLLFKLTVRDRPPATCSMALKVPSELS